MQKRKEGFIKVLGGKVWYEIVGEKKNIPVIVLHGGPGYPHFYLKPLKDLSNNREVIFYDQLGCGNSDWPTDNSLWTIKRFVAELKEIVKNLRLQKYHILGHSWGAALAVSFALTKPKGIKSLILSNSYLSTPVWEKDAYKLIQLLPKGMQKAILNPNSKGFKKASEEFYSRFINRLKPLPPPFKLSKAKKNQEIYNYMWGPKEHLAIGSLKNFDVTDKLHEITIPVLLLCGRYDEATPKSTEYFKSLFPNVQSKIFEDSAHYPFWNERKVYIKTVNNFFHNLEE